MTLTSVKLILGVDKGNIDIYTSSTKYTESQTKNLRTSKIFFKMKETLLIVQYFVEKNYTI